jgi:AraC family transcriptional regulator
MLQCLSRGQFYGQTTRHRLVGGLNLIETRYAPHTRLPRHSHEHSYFCLVRRGHYQEDYGSHQRDCGPQTVAFHPPGELHAQRFAGDETWSFNVEIGNSWLARWRDRLGRTELTGDFNGGVIGCLALRLYSEFLQSDEPAALAIEGLTLEILAAAWRVSLPAIERTPPRWLAKVHDILQDRFADPPMLTELANEAAVHPVYVSAAFHRHYGCTVGAFIRRRRVEFACGLLGQTDASIAEVALAAGFADQSHFSRAFKRITGFTPLAYRRTAGLA